MHGACLFTDSLVTRRFTEVVSQWLNTCAPPNPGKRCRAGTGRTARPLGRRGIQRRPSMRRPRTERGQSRQPGQPSHRPFECAHRPTTSDDRPLRRTSRVSSHAANVLPGSHGTQRGCVPASASTQHGTSRHHPPQIPHQGRREPMGLLASESVQHAISRTVWRAVICNPKRPQMMAWGSMSTRASGHWQHQSEHRLLPA